MEVAGAGLERELDFFCFSRFPNGGDTDIVFVTVLHSSWDSSCVMRWSLRNAGRTDTAGLTSCCSGGGPRQPWSSGLAPVSRFHSSVSLFPHVPPWTLSNKNSLTGQRHRMTRLQASSLCWQFQKNSAHLSGIT